MSGRSIYGLPSLAAVVACLRGEEPWPESPRAAPVESVVPLPDLADVRGQPIGRYALEVAAAGGHHLLMMGPPGAGKTMLASRLPGLLPPLTDQAALETTRIHSAAGLGLPAGGAGAAAALPGAAPRRLVGRAGRRRQRDDAAGRDLRGVQRRPVPGRAGRVRGPRARRPAAAVGGGGGASGSRRRHRDVSRSLPAGGGHEPVSVRLRRAPGRLSLLRCGPGPLPPPTVGPAARSVRPARRGHATVGLRPDGPRPLRADGRRAQPGAGGAGDRRGSRHRRRTPPSRSTASTSSRPWRPRRARCWRRRSAAAASPHGDSTGFVGWPAPSPTCRAPPARSPPPTSPPRSACEPTPRRPRPTGPCRHDRRPRSSASRPCSPGTPPWARAGSASCSARRARRRGGSRWAAIRGRPAAPSLAAHRAAGVEMLRRGRAGVSRPARAATRIRRPSCSPLGDLTALDATRVAIVGTRRCTGSGAGFARELGRELTEAGVAVVSGLALGIDGASHRGVLDAGGRPIGVVGSGLDVVYPSRHRDLWAAGAAAEGLLLSEAPLGARPAAWRFPARNRIIAGLAELVVVVESHAAGGSMHTVREAADRDIAGHGRPGLGALPRPCAGTNQLLAEGCAPVRDATDVLVALGLIAATLERPSIDSRVSPDPRGEQVLDAFDWEPATLEHLAVRTGLALPDLALAAGVAARGRLDRGVRRLVRAGGGMRHRPAPPPVADGTVARWPGTKATSSPRSRRWRRARSRPTRGDLAGFVEWAERGGVTGPADVDRTLLRRYVAHLATRRYAKRSIARKVSALRRYFTWAARTEPHPARPVERAVGASGRRPPAARPAPGRARHAARRPARRDRGRRPRHPSP